MLETIIISLIVFGTLLIVDKYIQMGYYFKPGWSPTEQAVELASDALYDALYDNYTEQKKLHNTLKLMKWLFEPEEEDLSDYEKDPTLYMFDDYLDEGKGLDEGKDLEDGKDSEFRWF